MAGKPNDAAQARTVLEYLLWSADHTYEEMAAQFEAVARDLGERTTITPRHLRRLASGERTGTTPATRRVFQAMFGQPVDVLLSPWSDHDGSLADQLGEMTAAPANSKETGRGGIARSGRSRVASSRRKTAGSPVHEVANQDEEISMAAEESARFAEFAEQTNIGPHTLEQFAADIRRIVTVYPNRPVYPLFVELRSLRDRAFEKLEGRQFPGQSRDLYLIAGTLNGILSNASFDLGRLDAAETQARTAFLCAELAGSNWLRAWIRGTQALIAYWDDRPLAAVRLAEDGRQFVPESGTAMVRLVSIQARAHGMLHDPRGVDAALGLADDARAATLDGDEPGGMMAFPPAKQHYSASTARLWLGDLASARRAGEDAELAVREYESAAPEQRRLGEWNLARLDRAAARLTAGEIESTVTDIRRVIDVTRDRPIESVSRRMRQVYAALEAPQYKGVTLVSELRDEMRTAVTASARPAIPGTIAG